MRHSVYGKKLGRDKNQRTALFRGLIRSLFLNESINTTQTKASAIKGLVDHLITAGKKNTPASLRILESFLTQANVITKLTQDIAKRYSGRNSGFTQVYKLGKRYGDNTLMVKMSLIDKDKTDKIEKVETEEKTVLKKPKTKESKV
ncbi:MAG: 50S ribosomal protein L17 [Candidatus Daviesbacteria bacterium]|nr:50S ribosomal protein L17 [Candidatus Daviesbacteria bacterium]